MILRLPPKRNTLGLPPKAPSRVSKSVRLEAMLQRRTERSTPTVLMDEEVYARQGKLREMLDVEQEVIHIGPQPGPQSKFASCTADICVYGGAAGGGKSYGLLLEDLPHIHLEEFSSVTFRRTYKQINLPGGLWEKARGLYKQLGATPVKSEYEFRWPSGARSTFHHLEHEENIFDWQGGQIALMKFDELTHFTSRMFWYLTSRLRSTAGIKPYIRCTTNPEPGSWVINELIGWWIGEDGFPIPERDGVLRFFCRQGETIVWGDSAEELLAMKPDDVRADEWLPRSVTFIASKLDDNPALTQVDPLYRASLAAMPLYERELLLKGNWKVKPGKGMRFRRQWFQIVDTLPELGDLKAYYDRAATEPSPQSPDPDYTAKVKGGRGPGGILYVTDVKWCRKTAAGVERFIMDEAKADRCHIEICELWLEQDPAQAGKVERHHLAGNLEAYMPRFCAPNGNRYVRSGPASTAAENGYIKLLRAPWNERFLTEVESFVDERVMDLPAGYHDDITTAFVGWYERMMFSKEAA
jgi:predicted phage terminase large subunit-like protein